MEEDEEVADSGGDSNTSTCEREVIERLFGGFVEDIIYIFFIGMCVDGKKWIRKFVGVFRYASVESSSSCVNCWLLLSCMSGGGSKMYVGDNRDHLQKARSGKQGKNEGQEMDRSSVKLK